MFLLCDGLSMQVDDRIIHSNTDLIRIFDSLFVDSHHTKLIDAGGEPVYLPADAQNPFHRICFAHGYFSSALHELAHWLVAGEKRRLQEDYGYWYNPDGRNPVQQQLFEQVESKPQAIEWMLHKACGKRFFLSVDNLSLPERSKQQFALAVFQWVSRLLDSEMNARMVRLLQALARHYAQSDVLCHNSYQLSEL